jgi:hypothetical protein
MIVVSGRSATAALAPVRLRGGRARGAYRVALTDILFVLCSGLLGELLLAELDCSSSMTYWAPLSDWQAADGRAAPALGSAQLAGRGQATRLVDYKSGRT